MASSANRNVDTAWACPRLAGRKIDMRFSTLIRGAWEVARSLWTPSAPPPSKPVLRSPHFSRVTEVAATPPSETVRVGEFYHVVYAGTEYWVLFRCPCKCGDVISLQLQRAQHPHWKINLSRAGRPTLYPSVWRNTGCKSHFWVNDGFVNWCDDSGRAPHLARPDLYSPRE